MEVGNILTLHDFNLKDFHLDKFRGVRRFLKEVKQNVIERGKALDGRSKLAVTSPAHRGQCQQNWLVRAWLRDKTFDVPEVIFEFTQAETRKKYTEDEFEELFGTKVVPARKCTTNLSCQPLWMRVCRLSKSWNSK
jgi:hypothetical protein